MIPATMQTMAWAYQQICAGEDPWTALGNFTNAWYDYARDMRTALVSEPLAEPEQATEHTLRWGGFLRRLRFSLFFSAGSSEESGCFEILP